MSKKTIEPQETVKVIKADGYSANGEVQGKKAGIFYVRGEGGDFAMAKRRQYLSDEAYHFPDTTSLTIGLEKKNDDALYVKNLSPTNTLTFYFDKQDFIIDSLNVGGQKTSSQQVAQIHQDIINGDGSVAQRIEVDLTEYSRTTVEFFVNHDSSVPITIEASNDPENDGWVQIDSTSASKFHDGQSNAFRYVALEVGAGASGDDVTAIVNGAE